MKRWLIASILFLLPSCIAFPLVRIFGGEGYSFGRKSRIGFSLILTSGIYLGEGGCDSKWELNSHEIYSSGHSIAHSTHEFA